MADLPFDPSGIGTASRLLPAVDPDGKILRAIETLGPVAGRDVVLLGRAPARERTLAALGSRVTVVDAGAYREVGSATSAADPSDATVDVDAVEGPGSVRHVVGTPAATGLPPGSADVVLAHFSALQEPDEAAVAEADRVLRPDGRLLVVADYGRDDLDPLRDPERRVAQVAANRTGGWFLARGFRIRVIHAWWVFDDLDVAAGLLRGAFGGAAEAVIATMRRPRLAHKVAIYHRAPGAGAARGTGSPPRAPKPSRRGA